MQDILKLNSLICGLIRRTLPPIPPQAVICTAKNDAPVAPPPKNRDFAQKITLRSAPQGDAGGSFYSWFR